jgi:hypothetical protein
LKEAAMQQQFLIDVDPVTGKHTVKPNGGNGRPKGAANHKHKMLQRLAQAHSIPLMERLIAEAEAGDMYAMRIIMDRLWPRPRTAPVDLGLERTQTPADLREAMHSILERVSKGELTTDDGASVIQMMKDMIAAHSIDTMTPGGPGMIQAADARNRLAERLERIIEARAAESVPQNGESDPASEDARSD